MSAVAAQQRLTVVPIKQAEAKAFVTKVHRHHPAPTGSIFQLAVADEYGEIRGVAIGGRPVAPPWDDGWTIEVNRTATDGCENANSCLYGAAWRAAKALGWRRLVTYGLASESGSSLRAAGYVVIAERKARSWADSSVARPRVDTNSVTGQEKLVWAPRECAHLFASEDTGGSEERVCSDCGREVEDGSVTAWHCRYCGPRDEDETHIETVQSEDTEKQSGGES